MTDARLAVVDRVIRRRIGSTSTNKRSAETLVTIIESRSRPREPGSPRACEFRRKSFDATGTDRNGTGRNGTEGNDTNRNLEITELEFFSRSNVRRPSSFPIVPPARTIVGTTRRRVPKTRTGNDYIFYIVSPILSHSLSLFLSFSEYILILDVD